MSTGSHSSSRFSQYSAQSSSSRHSQHSDGSDGLQSHDSGSANIHKSYRDRTQAWWTVGEFLEAGRGGGGITHQSARFTLTGNRVFGNPQSRDDLWDLSDSLAELYELSKHSSVPNQHITGNRRKGENTIVNEQEWLSNDTTHGFIRVYTPDTDVFTSSQVLPVTLSTTAHKVCLMLGISLNALHVQLHGDIIRRLDPYEHPLVIQNEYLAGLGFSDVCRIQEEGAKDELGYLIRFYSGKPIHDGTFSRNQLTAYIDVKKGKVITNWSRRLCVISGTRLMIYKDKFRRSKPTVIQLAKGSVEEIKLKGHDLVLKLTTSVDGDRQIHLSFQDVQEYNKWYRKCKKATDKLPTSADLSNCHLEFLPETIFINQDLAMLNLRHNVLKERPIEEDIYTIGWIDDLPRFTHLRSLNVADNSMKAFPQCLCSIKTLVELNIASNKLDEIPPEIGELTNLQALHIHNNHLTSLPDELVNLHKLFILVLAFNHFTCIPPVVAQMTDVRTSEIENMIMAGNQVEKLSSELLTKMKYVKKVDLRLNQLSLPPGETMKFTVLEHLTHLDIRDNMVTDLDIRSLKTLEYLNCERNNMTSLQINGLGLKNLYAGHNALDSFSCNPKPEWLTHMDVSYNNLRRLPEWLSDCFFLQKLYASHNQLIELPSRIFTDAKKLKSLRVNHNQLCSLPPDMDSFLTEEIQLQHNSLTRFPQNFFAMANKLRVLNATHNKLTSLPPVNEIEDLNKLQELYLTSNSLDDRAMDTISGFPRLKILHIAYNEVQTFYDRHMLKLELLQELNISGNQIRRLPASIGELSKLVVLRAHSNMLTTIPDLHNAKALRVLDVGHNQLLNVSVTNLMASQLNLLDMSLNAQLKVDPQEFRHINFGGPYVVKRHKKTVCLVDLTGQNRTLPGLTARRRRDSIDEDEEASLPWKVGFAETSGIRNKLCVGTLKILKFGSDNEAVFAMFDGGHNNEVPKILIEKFADILKEELNHHRTRDKYMKFAMLTAHRELKASGQRLGASSVVCHLRKMITNNMDRYTLQLANVGDVEAVLCRRGEAMKLTRKFCVTSDREEALRIHKTDGIITEDNKVNGTTVNTRMLGCSYLFPHVIPDPHSATLALRHDDEFIIIANQGLWKYVSYDEAVEEVYDIGNPVIAAKKLQDVAQGYGSKENICILVIRLNTDSRPSLAKLKKNRTLSEEDFDSLTRNQPGRVAEVPPRLRVSTGDLLSEKAAMALPPQDEPDGRGTYVVHNINIDGSPKPQRNDKIFKPPGGSSQASPKNSPKLKPLPKQRFRKKNAAVEWEAVLQKRLTEDVKDKEMRHSVRQLLDSSEELVERPGKYHAPPPPREEEPVVTPEPAEPISVEIKAESVPEPVPVMSTNAPTPVYDDNWSSLERKQNLAVAAGEAEIQGATLRNRTITPPWVVNASPAVASANPAYLMQNDTNEKEIINMTSQAKSPGKQPKIWQKIAIFENMNRPMSVVSTGSKPTMVLESDERRPKSAFYGATSPVNGHPKSFESTKRTAVVNGMAVNGAEDHASGQTSPRVKVERSDGLPATKGTDSMLTDSPHPGEGAESNIRIIEIARL